MTLSHIVVSGVSKIAGGGGGVDSSESRSGPGSLGSKKENCSNFSLAYTSDL